MSATGKARLLIGVLCAATIALPVLLGRTGDSARAAEPPTAGGKVPSTLGLSLSQPSPFTRSARGLFTATLRAEVTATDSPAKLSLTEGQADTLLRSWREPVTGAPMRIRLRQKPPSAAALRKGQKLLWVTLTAGGP